ncbi:hypothetical protein O3S80_51245, partial [Streptomyces sp. Lzd4kr]|nr:hypothetical protein [Streptomyces sp. Lzd4kr]
RGPASSPPPLTSPFHPPAQDERGSLKLKKRIKRFALDNELDHLPIGDIVSVALDEWLTTRGF